MNKQITIVTLTGSAPYDIYLCDNTYNNCMYIDTINGYDLPHSFLVPYTFLGFTEVGVKVIDNNNCTIKGTISI